jgi:hypothetical protein
MRKFWSLIAICLSLSAYAVDTTPVSINSTQTANTVLAGPTSGAASLPQFRAIVPADTITYATTVTASGTTTLTASSATMQVFTGTLTQTLTLPVVSTLVLGFQFQVINNSTGSVFVTSSGGQTITVVVGGTAATFTCILLTGTTQTSWSSSYSTAVAADIYVNNDTTTNATMYPTWITGSGGALPPYVSSTKLTFNPSSGTLTATTFSGAFSGTATNATNTAITDDTTTNATMYPTWVTANTGNLPQKVSSTKMTFNPSTGNLASTTFNGNTLTTGSYTLTGTAAKTLNFTNTLTLSGTDSTTMTFPSTTATIARTDAANTFTGVQTFNTAIAAGSGGTGQAGGYAVGDMLYASGASTLSKLADVAAGSYLRSGGVTTAPVWSTLTLPNAANSADILLASGANTIASTAMSGDVTINSTGVTAIGALKVTNAMIAASTIDLTAKVTGVLPTTNGGVKSAYVTSTFTKTTNTTTAAITGLSFNVTSGQTYNFQYKIFLTAVDATGGLKLDLSGGSATATTVRAQWNLFNNSTAAFTGAAATTALATTGTATAGSTSYYLDLQVYFVAGSTGTFCPAFAENVSSGSSSVAIGSFGIMEQ